MYTVQLTVPIPLQLQLHTCARQWEGGGGGGWTGIHEGTVCMQSVLSKTTLSRIAVVKPNMP